MNSLGKALALASLAGSALCAAWGAAAEDDPAERRPAAALITPDAKWCLRLPPGERVAYRGVASFDGAGTGTASFLYPAPNAGGFLAAVLTHALLVDSDKKDQKQKIQAAADQVLSPYQGVLDTFNYRDLMQRAVAKTATAAHASLVEESGDPGREIVVETSPVFSLTQDQKAIILDDAIVIRMPGSAPEDAYRNTVRVVSTAREVADPAAFWTANAGETLKDESAKLIAQSLDIAFRDAAAGTNPDGVPYRTIRYREGAAEKIERALVLNEQCDRMLIRTLRGTLMSVPASRPATVAAAGRCGPAPGP